MARPSKQDLFTHTQKYVREVFAEKLRNAGFVSKDGEDIYWYRLVNNDVLHVVCFYTRHVAFPVTLDIGFGCHPLFIKPVLQKNPYMYGQPGIAQILTGRPVMAQSNRIYAHDSMVMCPADETCGANLLDGILQTLDSIRTPQACYEIHKEYHSACIANDSWLIVTPQFVDEVIYWDDKSLYPYCEHYIIGMTEILENAQKSGNSLRQIDKETLDALRRLRGVVIDGHREEYLEVLRDREQQTILLLKKHTGIHVQE